MKKHLFHIFCLIAIPFLLIAQEPCVGTIALSRQSQIDSFRILYPTCTWLAGSLIIRPETGFETDISDLRPLQGIHRIGGNLIIESSPLLQNLHGLDSVKSVEGEFRIANCRSLKDVQGLNSLEFVNFDFSINDNDSLETLQGLERLKTLNQSLRCNRNPRIEDFAALTNLTTISSYIEITENENLKNLRGLESIKEVSGNVTLSFNSQLTSLSGLDSLQHVGSFILSFCPSIQDLEGLEQLETIQFWLTLERNEALMSLSGLESIQSIGFGLQLIDNTKLTDIALLGQAQIDGINFLRIQRNQMLSYCHLANICAYLNRGGDASMFLNAEGCRSIEEVLDNCTTVSTIDNSKIQFLQPLPNPFSDQLLIQDMTEANHSFEYEIIDFSGRNVLRGFIASNEPIQTHSLRPGLYIFHVKRNSTVRSFKVIKL